MLEAKVTSLMGRTLERVGWMANRACTSTCTGALDGQRAQLSEFGCFQQYRCPVQRSLRLSATPEESDNQLDVSVSPVQAFPSSPHPQRPSWQT